MFFVLGSRNSSNSVRLVEVAEQAGCQHAELIHSESVIPFEKIQNCKIKKQETLVQPISSADGLQT